MTHSLAELTQRLIEAARSAGADAADAVAVDGTSVSIDVRNGALEEAQRAEATDIGLRVFVGQKSANVSASDTSPVRSKALRKPNPPPPPTDVGGCIWRPATGSLGDTKVPATH